MYHADIIQIVIDFERKHSKIYVSCMFNTALNMFEFIMQPRKMPDNVIVRHVHSHDILYAKFDVVQYTLNEMYNDLKGVL
jgi:hypothetical protein